VLAGAGPSHPTPSPSSGSNLPLRQPTHTKQRGGTALLDEIRDPRMAGHFAGYRVCHHSRRAVCAGFWARHRDAFDLGQIAQRFDLMQFVHYEWICKPSWRKNGTPAGITFAKSAWCSGAGLSGRSAVGWCRVGMACLLLHIFRGETGSDIFRGADAFSASRRAVEVTALLVRAERSGASRRAGIDGASTVIRWRVGWGVAGGAPLKCDRDGSADTRRRRTLRWRLRSRRPGAGGSPINICATL
jgi:hypothetical protein